MTAPTSDLAADLASLATIVTNPDSHGGRTKRDAGTTAPDVAATSWQLVLTSEHADIVTGALDTPIVTVSDWDGVLRHFGLDPTEFEIVDDTVRMSRWQQSKRLENGDRDLIWLTSYKARFRRLSAQDILSSEVIDAMAARLRARRLPRRTPGSGLGAPCTATILPSDWQLGKPAIRQEDLEHGATGPEQTQWRIERAVERTQAKVKALRKVGRNIEGIGIGHMGDPTENIADSYEGETYQIVMNLTQQIKMALDLSIFIAEELLPLAEVQNIWAVLCNHGQLARRGTKTNITDDSDNVQNLLMRLQRDRIVGPKFPNARWHIPGEEMITTLNLSGVDVAAAHGHKIKGSESAWLLKQTANLQATRGIAPRVWLTAHRHSQDVIDLGAIHRIQAATADGGSKHFQDETAIYSTPGTTFLLIGQHDERGWSDLELL